MLSKLQVNIFIDCAAKKIQSLLKAKSMSAVGHFKDLPDTRIENTLGKGSRERKAVRRRSPKAPR